MEMYRVPLQHLKINYTVSTTNKKVYTEEEDRFLLVMLDRYGVDGEGLYEKIRDEIRESPLFRFDWFFLSRTPVEIGRRCTTLLNTVAREFDGPEKIINGHGPGKGNRREREDDDVENDDEVAPAKKKAKNGVVVSLVFGYICLLFSDVHDRTSRSKRSNQVGVARPHRRQVLGQQVLLQRQPAKRRARRNDERLLGIRSWRDIRHSVGVPKACHGWRGNGYRSSNER
jgi:SLIDE